MAHLVCLMRGRILVILIVLCVDFLTSNIFIYAGSKLLCFLSSFTKSSLELGFIGRRDLNQPDTNLIILSHARSGSSFLGQVFNHHPDVFYVYEPFYMIRVTTLDHSSFYETSALKLLDDILTCSFHRQDEFLSFLTNFPHRRYSSRSLTVPFCTPNQTDHKTGAQRYICRPLEPIYTSNVCSSYRHRVIKLLTHRIPNFTVNFFKPLMKSELNVKILQLVRDPRAIIASMERVGWSDSYTQTKSNKSFLKSAYHFEHRVKAFCISMFDTIKFILEAKRKLIGRYKLVRYEDLVRDIQKSSDDIIKFARFGSSDDVTRWIQKSTHARFTTSDQQNYQYSTERANISSLTDSWRLTLNRQQIIIIEKYCKPIMTVLQYPAVFSDHAQK